MEFDEVVVSVVDVVWVCFEIDCWVEYKDGFEECFVVFCFECAC